MRKRGQPSGIETVLDKCLDRALGTPGAAVIWRVWREAVGAAIADRATPMRLRGRTLVVAVSSPPWMQELNLLKRGLVTAVNARLAKPLIDDVFLVLTEGRTDAPPAPRRRPAPCPTPPAAGRELLETLPAPLRASFGGVLDAWQRRARTR